MGIVDFQCILLNEQTKAFKDGYSVALLGEAGRKGNDEVEKRGKDAELGATKTTRVNHFPVPILLRHDPSAQCLQINLWEVFFAYYME